MKNCYKRHQQKTTSNNRRFKILDNSLQSTTYKKDYTQQKMSHSKGNSYLKQLATKMQKKHLALEYSAQKRKRALGDKLP